MGNRWENVATHLARLQEVKVHLAVSTEARCPLDHLTHLLALATNLTSLAVFTPTLDNIARYNVTTNFRPLVLSKLQSLVLVLDNSTYPELVVRQFEDLVTSATTPAALAVYWSSRGHRAPHKVLISHPNDLAKKPKLGDVRKASFYSLPSGSELAGLKLEGLDLSFLEGRPGEFRGCPPTFPALPWLDWSHLRELWVPGGLVVDRVPPGAQNVTSSGSPSTRGKRVSHTSSKPTYSPAKLLQIAASAPLLRRLHLVWSRSPQPIVDAALLAVPSFTCLTSLRVNQPNSTIFLTILAKCSHLEELTIGDDDDDDILPSSLQKVVASLCSGLSQAKQLRVVRVKATLGTLNLGRLLGALASCPRLEQVVVVDPSSPLDTQPFPQAAVGALVKALPSLSYLHICSYSLTNLAIKQMKVVLRRERREGRRVLVWGLHRPTKSYLYDLADIAHLPAACLESLNTLITRRRRLVDYSYQELFAV